MTTAKNGNGHASAESKILEHLESGGKFEPLAKKKQPTDSDRGAALAGKIEIPSLKLGIVTLTIKGESPLIMHRFGGIAEQTMLDKHMGKAKQKRGAKVPTDDFLECFHWIGKPPKLVKREGAGEFGVSASGRWGMPAGGVQSAAISACRQVDGLKMTFARGVFRVLADDNEKNLVELFGSPVMRQDIARNSNGQPDIRFRPMFPEWSMKLSIKYDTKCITPEQIANLYNQAGFSVGLGDWRPERAGAGGYGCFSVVSTDEVLIKGRA